MEMKTNKTVEQTADFTKPIVRLSTKELMAKMFQLETKGTTFVQLFTKTVPQMRKTNNPYYGKVSKIAETNCQIGWIYENAVQNQRDREEIEEDFTPHPRQWGQHMINPITKKISRVMIDHVKKGGEYNAYTQMRTLSVKDVHYVDEKGIRLTDEKTAELKTFLSGRTKSKTQRTEKEIIVSDYNLDNIEKMVVNKVMYIINK